MSSLFTESSLKRSSKTNLKNKKRSKKRVAKAAAKAAAFESSARALNGLRAVRHGGSRIEQLTGQFKNAQPEQLAGRIAEELHAATFNIDAASKGLNALRARTNAANGAGTAAADIVITNAERFFGEAQVKFHGTPARTTFNVANVKYNGMQRIVPADQLQRVKEIAKKRGVDALGKRNFPEVASGASDRLRAKGVASTPLTRREALAISKNPDALAREIFGTQVTGAMKRGALNSAAIGGGLSAASNLIAYQKGQKTGTDAFVDTLKDSGTCAVTGAAITGSTIVAETLLVRAGAGALARGSTPVAIGLTVVDVGKDVGRLINGDIDPGVFAVKTTKNVAKGGCTWGGMEGGAALGTLICPGVGTLIGGLIGGMCGGLAGEQLFA